MKRIVLIAMLGLWPYMATSVRAADPSILPDKPQPQGKVRSENREFWIESAGLGAAWAMDAQSSSSRWAYCRNTYGAAQVHQWNCFESGVFFKGTQDTAKIMGAWAAVDIAAAVASYEWKNHVRNRYLHPLWRVPLIVGTAGHASSAIGNWAIPRSR